MKSESIVPESLLDGDKMQSVPATLPDRSNGSMPIGDESHLVGSHEENRAGDLRSFVAGRFMHMIRAHDRTRMKVLATHPTQAR